MGCMLIVAFVSGHVFATSNHPLLMVLRAYFNVYVMGKTEVGWVHRLLQVQLGGTANPTGQQLTVADIVQKVGSAAVEKSIQLALQG